jgi:Zn-dependent protease with chaperone function
VLAVSSLAALGGLLLSGALKLPLFARLGDLVHPLNVGSTTLLFPVTLLALGALAACTGTIARSVLLQWRLLRTAQSRAATLQLAGDLSVVNDEHADAYALPGNPGRIVVTSGMLRALTPLEREALFAHERAHLRCRHHYFLAVAELAAHCHPALRQVCGTISLAAERTADEAAALATGDRRLTARAIGRAALASRRVAHARSSFTPAATTGPVPRRVAALLQLPTGPRRLVSGIAVLLVLSAAVSSGATLVGGVSLHHSVEAAQGEVVGP